LQGHQLLHVLGGHQGLGGSNGVFQHGAGGVQVQGGDALGAGESGVGQGQQGFDVGFVGGNDLLGGGGHDNLLSELMRELVKPNSVGLRHLFGALQHWFELYSRRKDCQQLFVAPHKNI
jgi:hypothetical protein